MPPRKQKKAKVESDESDIEGIQENSRASGATFQAKRRKLYEEARKSIKNTTATSIQLLEQGRAQILSMRTQVDKADGILKDYTQLHTTQEGAYTQWHRSSGTLARDWGQQRSAMIDDASKMLNTTAIRREASLNAFLKGAKLQVKERKEQEELATDASVLIRQYKNLLIGAK